MIQIIKIYFFICLFIIAGCGYSFVGQGSLPSGIKTLEVRVFENDSGDTGIETTFTDHIIYELTRTGRKIVSNNGDAILTGKIRSTKIETISRIDSHSSLERRITVALDLKLIKSSDQNVTWVLNGLRDCESYVVSQDKMVTEQNRKNALLKISERIAENICNVVTSDF